MAEPSADLESLVAEAEELRLRLDVVARQLELLGGLGEDKRRALASLSAVQGGRGEAEGGRLH